MTVDENHRKQRAIKGYLFPPKITRCLPRLTSDKSGRVDSSVEKETCNNT